MPEIKKVELLGFSLRVRAETAEDMQNPTADCELLFESAESIDVGDTRRISATTYSVMVPGAVRPQLAMMLAGGLAAPVEDEVAKIAAAKRCPGCGDRAPEHCDSFADVDLNDEAALERLAVRERCAAAAARLEVLHGGPVD